MHERITHFMGSLDRMLCGVGKLTADYRPTLGGERFLNDKEVAARLKISRRTLQDSRNEGRISYSGWAEKSFMPGAKWGRCPKMAARLRSD